MNWPHEEQTITPSDSQAAIARRHPSHVENLDRTWPVGEHDIALAEARELIARRRRIAMESGGAFKKEALDRLLAQPGCVGMRIYYGVHPDGRPAMVLVAVDEHGEELLKGALLEQHYPCPPFCPIGP
ncbi:MAG TPA: hypothetical protein VMH88_10110, partial [Gemmatimonadales bacterium]|nr:hypothetical protein [Gemmatimonadales bacterium]